MKRVLKVSLEGTVMYQKEGKVDRILSTTKEIKKALKEGATVDCYWVGGAEKTRTYKAFSGLVKRLKEKEKEEKEIERQREVAKKIKEGTKLSKIGNLVSLSHLLYWLNETKLEDIVKRGLDDIGLLETATWTEVNRSAITAKAWLLLKGNWNLKDNFDKNFERNFKRFCSLEEALKIAEVKADRDVVLRNIYSSKTIREKKSITREERIKEYIVNKGIIMSEHGFPMIKKRELWEKVSKTLRLKKETRVKVSRTLGAFRGRDFDIKESILFELSRKDQCANGLAAVDQHLAGGPVTLLGYKKIKKIFLTDAWTEYEGGELVSSHEKTYGQSFRDRYVVDTMSEANFIMQLVGEYNLDWSQNHHLEIITEGDWLETPTASVKTDEFVSSDEDIEFAIREAAKLIYFLEDKGIETTNKNCYKDEVIEAAAKAELSFGKVLELEDLIPANSKISLWD